MSLTRLPSAVATALGTAARHAFEVYHPPAGKPGRTPADKGLPQREFTLTTSRDGIALHGWAVPGAGPDTVVLCHGMGRTKSSTLAHIQLLHRAGWHVVAYDMRNHGESGRDRRLTRMADRYTDDLADVLRWVHADPQLGGGQVALVGFSFSTWVCLNVLRRIGHPVAAVVCDSGPMYDIGAGLRHFATLRRGTLPAELTEGLPAALYRRAFGLIGQAMLVVREWPPDLRAVPTRLMFVAGGQDAVVPPAQIAPVAARYPDAVSWTAPNALHMNAIRFDAADYRERVLGFLTEAFGPAGKDLGPGKDLGAGKGEDRMVGRG